ncbi:HesA/MoeB/ThiF family protein [Secundilactobacillus folii]|uniref:HesA/MoeB/ThiF family protein n=1 Tax=Secundilactobacillus folii TaxID=2678357 RepID=A0A7X2XV38_9LACO|nr:HesA/MoeB/ThiF family protein [Secundilactobacillus folii]MTV82166.1 HesA/MoeB/ThiF family protein [Secundilactobacillus folii]
MNRYDRQERVRTIGVAGQRRICASTILIAGVGALGSYTASQLVRAGVAHLILVDPDIVSTTNLQRQALFTEQDVKDQKFKVTAARDHLLAINHNVQIDIYPEALTKLHLTTLHFDLVCDCLDNFKTRDLLNKAAINQGFDFIFASCAGNFGSVMAMSPAKHPCLSCLYPNLDSLMQTDCDLIGVNTALVPLVSGLQVSLALHYLVDKTGVNFDQLITIDNWQMMQQSYKVNKDHQCPICSRHDWPLTEAPQAEQLQVLCGTQTYSVKFSAPLTLQTFSNWLTDRNVQSHQFKRFLTFRWQTYAISYFDNGKLLLYGMPTLAAATKIFNDLKQALPIAEEQEELQK